VTFVDTNVVMYAVGRPHPLKAQAEAFFERAVREGTPLVTSAEVLQELLHAYLPPGRMETLDAALELVESLVETIWAVEEDDVRLARALVSRHPGLSARDLLHLACCQRRDATEISTFDRPLAAAFKRRSGRT
jgi:predicted nucleic acid-binding protein